jgi:hypothetical protein
MRARPMLPNSSTRARPQPLDPVPTEFALAWRESSPPTTSPANGLSRMPIFRREKNAQSTLQLGRLDSL